MRKRKKKPKTLTEPQHAICIIVEWVKRTPKRNNEGLKKFLTSSFSYSFHSFFFFYFLISRIYDKMRAMYYFCHKSKYMWYFNTIEKQIPFHLEWNEQFPRNFTYRFDQNDRNKFQKFHLRLLWSTPVMNIMTSKRFKYWNE